MPVIHYPFIDIAVHEHVRDRFAAGEAVVIFSPDVKTVLWSNGRGARLFGHDSVYDFLDQGPRPQDLVFRQIETAGRRLTTIGDASTLTIRVSAGFQSIPVSARCELAEIAGDTVVLFTAPIERAAVSQRRSAAGMLEGLNDPDTHIAVLDSDGSVIAASQDFDSLGLTLPTARMLVTLAGNDPTRLVKRPVSTAKGYLPTALGKLSDAPALHLLLIVEASPAMVDPAPEPDHSAPSPPENLSVPTAAEGSFADVIDAVASIEETGEPQETIVLDLDIPDREPVPVPAPAPDDAAEDLASVADQPLAQTVSNVVSTDREPPVSESMPAPAVAEAAPADFVFKRDARAMRFVWKIDREGRFSEVSDEFATTVGPRAAAINGMAFSDVASLFHLDPEGKIGELLGRRDTWSGKTIWWPVEGTSLIVPIDLAALPTYTRDRTFDGFRGFGIVRVGDAVEDPHASGLTLGHAEDDTPADAETDMVEDEAVVVNDEPPAATHAPDELEAGLTHSSNDNIDLAEEQAAPAPHGETTGEITDAPTVGEPYKGQDHELPEGEKPALRLVDSVVPSDSEKVVRLPSHSQRGQSLSPVERAAFREIARHLDRFIGPRNDAKDTDQLAPSSDAPETPGDRADAHTLLSQDNPADTAQPHDEETVEAAQPTDDLSSLDRGVDDEDDVNADAGDKAEPTIGADADEEEAHAPEPQFAYAGMPVRERISLSAEVLDQMPVALLVHNGDSLLHGNPEFLRLTGYSSIEALAEVGGLDALLQREDLDETGDRTSGMMVVRADDALVPVTARLQSVRFGQVTALMLALMPVSTETAEEGPASGAKIIPLPTGQMAEEAAQVEVEELRAILETATDGVVVIGTDGNIRSLNRAASALFNYDGEEANGKPFVMLFAHESQKAIMDYLGGLSGHGVASVLNDGREVIGREASGGFIPLFMTIGTLTSSNGYCAVIRDITQWKRTEEELRTAKRSAETANAHKSEFLAHVSHEIRTPLNAIIGFADLMASERFGPIGHPRYVEYSNDIVRSGRHVLDIVNDLLDISKIEAGEMELDFVSVELNESISEAVSLVQPQANGQRVIIRTALSHAVPPVVADLRSVKQIVLNILSNAIRFTPSGGQIVVSTVYEANGSVVLRIRDTGIGMTRSELELAMKPFRQVAGSTRQRGDGTGLGLPLTKAMVDANRATFAINSAPREGTLIEITFPPQRVLAN